MSAEKRRVFLSVFARLRLAVIWKWDEAAGLGELPASVLVRQWVPQQDILAHPHTRCWTCPPSIRIVITFAKFR